MDLDVLAPQYPVAPFPPCGALGPVEIDTGRVEVVLLKGEDDVELAMTVVLQALQHLFGEQDIRARRGRTVADRGVEAVEVVDHMPGKDHHTAKIEECQECRTDCHNPLKQPDIT